jgi:hypothetical protein
LLQDATTVAPQQPTAQVPEKHVLYFEKKSRSRKKGTAHQEAPSMHQDPGQQPTPAMHQDPSRRPFVPPKKKQMKSSHAIGQSTSQPDSQPSTQRQRETIRMSDVVTESVPKEGRLKWFLLGNEKRGQQGGEE